jgi:Trm5-related predicted tRNA methylase
VKATEKPAKSAALLGLGLDNDDGHTRLTRGKNFVLLGGSQDTHRAMQETAIKINERLDRQGKRLEDVSIKELREICHDVKDSLGKCG